MDTVRREGPVAKTLTVAKMMSVVASEGWAMSAQPRGNRFQVTVWNADRTRHVAACHAYFGAALHRALQLAFHAQGQRDRQPGLALPSPELLASVMESAAEVVA